MSYSYLQLMVKEMSKSKRISKNYIYLVLFISVMHYLLFYKNWLVIFSLKVSSYKPCKDMEFQSNVRARFNDKKKKLAIEIYIFHVGLTEQKATLEESKPKEIVLFAIHIFVLAKYLSLNFGSGSKQFRNSRKSYLEWH